MRTIHNDLTDPAAELAFDEAVLLDADEFGGDDTLRLWEFTRPVVVLGRSSKFDSEVDQTFCDARQIPVLRRCSGGASIAAGPGCLMYSVVLSFERRPELQKIDVAHRFVMQRLLDAVQVQLPSAQMQGTCDLTFDDRKFSGNSVRIARRNLLYHGTILYDADLELIANCLATPPRQPEYRHQRAHSDFITNLQIDPFMLRKDIEQVFGENDVSAGQPDFEQLARVKSRTQELLDSRYHDPAWHRRH